MVSKVFVIHPSVIIREGIASLLKVTFEQDAKLLTDLSELDNYKDIRNQKLLFLIDAETDQENFHKRTDYYNKANRTNIILIRTPGSPTQCDDNCNCCFYTDISQISFESLLKPYFERKNGDSAKSNSGLTDREIDVVKLVALGRTNKDIAEKLCISIHTVISHRKNITEKLGIKSISGLTVYAILNNLINAKNIDRESLI